MRALGGAKQRGVLAILVLHRGEVLSSECLIDELWGGRAPATAAKALQGYVSRLRKALGRGLVHTEGRGYRLALAPGQLDLDEFERLAAEGRGALSGGDPATAADRLGRALDLWRGPPLADFAYEPFARAEIARLEEARVACLEDRIEADLALGRHAAIVGALEALIAEHPYRERLRATQSPWFVHCGKVRQPPLVQGSFELEGGGAPTPSRFADSSRSRERAPERLNVWPVAGGGTSGSPDRTMPSRRRGSLLRHRRSASVGKGPVAPCPQGQLARSVPELGGDAGCEPVRYRGRAVTRSPTTPGARSCSLTSLHISAEATSVRAAAPRPVRARGRSCPSGNTSRRQSPSSCPGARPTGMLGECRAEWPHYAGHQLERPVDERVELSSVSSVCVKKRVNSCRSAHTRGGAARRRRRATGLVTSGCGAASHTADANRRPRTGAPVRTTESAPSAHGTPPTSEEPAVVRIVPTSAGPLALIDDLLDRRMGRLEVRDRDEFWPPEQFRRRVTAVRPTNTATLAQSSDEIGQAGPMPRYRCPTVGELLGPRKRPRSPSGSCGGRCGTKPSASTRSMPSGRSRYRKCVSACSPNGRKSSWTLGGK